MTTKDAVPTPRTYEERAFDAENTVERLERELAAMTADRASAYESLRRLQAGLVEAQLERDALRELMLDMRQHQGAIQPYIKRMDAALAAQEKP